MRLSHVVSILLIASSATPLSAAPLRVADGDCTALQSILAAPGDKEVLLAARGNYRACGFSVQGSAHVDAAGAAVGPIVVAQDAKLFLRNARIGVDGTAPVAARRYAGNATATLPPGSASFIINAGELTLESSSISGVHYGLLRDADTPMINSAGALTLRNVTIVDNTAHNGAGLIGANGPLNIVHSTLVGAMSGEQYRAPTLVGGEGTATIANSILRGNGIVACAHAGISSGGNVFSDASCGEATADVVGDAGLGDTGLHGGVVQSVSLQASSAAIGRGLPALCEAVDARGAARDAAATRRCDAGAYEFGGGNGHLTAGGINGSFYDAASDGHYVMIQRIDARLALVTWSTFDNAGSAALVYGVGEANDGHIHVTQAARNSGGTLGADGVPHGQRPEPWGSIDITLPNCNAGTFAYTSNAPTFGHGSFKLTRLVALDTVECSE